MKKNHKNKPKNRDFRRIVVAVDGSKYSKRAVKTAINLAKGMGTKITVLHVAHQPISVYPGFSGIYPGAIHLIKKDGNLLLKKMKEIGLKMGVNLQTKLVVGHPDQEIVKEAGRNDLIIIGCKGHSDLSSILLGNVCEKVMHHANSPVMVIR